MKPKKGHHNHEFYLLALPCATLTFLWWLTGSFLEAVLLSIILGIVVVLGGADPIMLGFYLAGPAVGYWVGYKVIPIWGRTDAAFVGVLCITAVWVSGSYLSHYLNTRHLRNRD